MTIDKELFYASHGLEYPVVARPYNDMVVKEKFYTKADVMDMLTELKKEIEEIKIDVPFGFEPVSKTAAFYEGVSESSRLIQQKINALKGEE